MDRFLVKVSAWQSTFFAVVIITSQCDGGSGDPRTSPVLQYRFCKSKHPQTCLPIIFGSNSTFRFGDITSGTIFFDKEPFWPSLSISCTSREPLIWQVHIKQGYHLESLESTAHDFDGVIIYHYRIFMEAASSGRFRCTSYEDSGRAAEILIVQREETQSSGIGSQSTRYGMSGERLLPFLVFPSASGFFVPCYMGHFTPQHNFSSMRVFKAPLSKVMMETPTEACIKCYPRLSPAPNSSSCSKCGPFGLSRSVWEAAGEPSPGMAVHTNDFHKCTSDYNCSVQVLRTSRVTPDDCNTDRFLSCSDFYTTHQSYPEKCDKKGDLTFSNFRKIEGCMIKGSMKRDTHTTVVSDYDPRIGFRVRGKVDYTAMYKCPQEDRNYGVHLIPVRSEPRGFPKVTYLFSGSSRQIECSIPRSLQLRIRLVVRPCSSYSDCEMWRLGSKAYRYIRSSSKTVWGVLAETPFTYSAIVSDPPGHGVLLCESRALLNHTIAFALTEAYFFTGLDNEPYLTSDFFPTEAVITISAQDRVLHYGSHAKVICRISTFVLFPTFRLFRKFRNGNTSQVTAAQRDSPGPGKFIQLLTFPVFIDKDVSEISCSALLRNSTVWLRATISLDDVIAGSMPEGPTDTASAKRRYQYAPIALASVATTLVILLLVVYVLRRLNRNQSDELLEMDTIYGLDLPPDCLIPSDYLHIDWDKVLGEGQFGRCVAGKYLGREVAVKVTKDDIHADALTEFVKEITLMATMGKHENVVEFIGAVLERREKSCKAVAELSPFGNLLGYLRQYGNTVDTMPHYAHMTEKLELRHLCYFCEQIASGMEFLSGKSIIHGDLAARNVLVFQNNVVKLTDFGLSRKLYNYSVNYVKTGHAPLPWRWMALECLKYLEFSTMSDMWAFGVTAWEIFTLGQLPFLEYRYSSYFKQQLEKGLRLEQPQLAPDSIYQFMSSTWSTRAHDRPEFSRAKEFFLTERHLAMETTCVGLWEAHLGS